MMCTRVRHESIAVYAQHAHVLVVPMHARQYMHSVCAHVLFTVHAHQDRQVQMRDRATVREMCITSARARV